MKRALLLWVLAVCGILHANAQSQTVTGKVTDAVDGSPLPGVTITLKGTSKGAVTSPDGTYQLTAELNSTLVFSFVGYESKEIKLTEGGKLNVALKTDNKKLDEVVVTALGIKRDKRILSYTTQEVKGDVLTQSKETNFLNGLQGHVAGVQITNNTGMAGSGARILIRGASSLTGENQPLFVIDGVPIDNNQNPAGTDDPLEVGGSTPNRGIDIDPNIIESINILRGASATALYGSHAAGGAVIITTKSGSGVKGGKGVRVSIASSLSFDDPILPKFQTKYAQGTGGVFYDGSLAEQTSQSWGPRIDTLKVNGAPVKTYNPRKDFFQTGITTDNSISAAGNTEMSNYLLSFSSLKQNGIVPHTDYLRNSFYASFTTKLTDKFTATVNINYINSSNNRLPEGNNSGYLWGVYNAPVTWDIKPVFDSLGNQRVFRAGLNNPLWSTQNSRLKLGLERFIPNVTLNYTPVKWLTLTERIGADYYQDTRDYHEAIGSITRTQGALYNEQYTYKSINHDFFAQFHKQLASKFDLSVMLGNNIQAISSQDNFQSANGLDVENFYNISNSGSISNSANALLRRRVSVYGQAVLDYNRMLTLTVTGRNDWSSTLPIANRSFFYPSVSGAFIFSELKGLKGSKALTFGKLRAAYTAIGNDAGAYQTSTVFYKASVGDGLGGTITVPFNNKNAFAINNVEGKSDLKSESIKEFEVGLETKWLDNRIGLEIDYYRKKSTNLIFTTPVSASTGFNSSIINAGDIRNNGVEVTLDLTPIRTKDFTWNIHVNWAQNKGEIKELYPGVSEIQTGGFVSPGIYLIQGHSFGSIKGTAFERDAKGRKLVDENGYYIPNPIDTIIGETTPKWIGGLSTDLIYKNFTLSVTMDKRQGGDIMNLDQYYMTTAGVSPVTLNREGTTVLKGVTEDGKENTKPIATNQAYYRGKGAGAFETFVQDGSFFKLRNVTLAYSFGQKVLGHSPIKNATFSLTGRNLYIHAPHFTGSDPELGLYGASSNAQGFYNYVTPSSRSYNATLKLTF
ncbi:TonB-linked outer membrane protein, SusC/RagA family [Chitinophaga costaii]|uniref:TonB-linked outer membrane protein, SusC/RagA family n=1 Tax=Chitinophaga costaii TaxID=1335309 RepID=A0A1C4DXL5_9BACT|nr:SusC/RagA family TonB-linked outer membrane protein [Chitinophaga costaii]PUZ27856.1 SusC/RagA family TonB-linked outer membrane protein [Chitinophaga costaii]SCC36134.1 TonB-linked outer membrane protein, SusC/RagA family [Chitinophaga costaii]